MKKNPPSPIKRYSPYLEKEKINHKGILLENDPFQSKIMHNVQQRLLIESRLHQCLTQCDRNNFQIARLIASKIKSSQYLLKSIINKLEVSAQNRTNIQIYPTQYQYLSKNNSKNKSVTNYSQKKILQTPSPTKHIQRQHDDFILFYIYNELGIITSTPKNQFISQKQLSSEIISRIQILMQAIGSMQNTLEKCQVDYSIVTLSKNFNKNPSINRLIDELDLQIYRKDGLDLLTKINKISMIYDPYIQLKPIIKSWKKVYLQCERQHQFRVENWKFQKKNLIDEINYLKKTKVQKVSNTEVRFDIEKKIKSLQGQILNKEKIIKEENLKNKMHVERLVNQIQKLKQQVKQKIPIPHFDNKMQEECQRLNKIIKEKNDIIQSKDNLLDQLHNTNCLIKQQLDQIYNKLQIQDKENANLIMDGQQLVYKFSFQQMELLKDTILKLEQQIAVLTQQNQTHKKRLKY